MNIKSTLSVAALLTSVVLGGSAYAQGMMIGNQTVGEADRAAVQARCDDLKLNADTESLSPPTSDDDAMGTDEETMTDDNSTTPDNDATVQEVPPTDSETAMAVDLDIITLEDCQTGGWFDM